MRPALAVGLLLLIVAIARVTGLDHYLEPARIRTEVAGAGAWGVLLFAVLYGVGQVLQVPGMVFVGVAVYVWGPFGGAAIGYAATLTSVSASFFLVRSVGGKALTEIQHPRMKKIMGTLETRPVRTVFLLRTLFLMSPPLNYALALTGVTYRNYLLGSALGLMVPVGILTGLFYWVLPVPGG